MDFTSYFAVGALILVAVVLFAGSVAGLVLAYLAWHEDD